MIRQHYSTDLVTEIARQGRDFFATFDQLVGGHSGWVQCGLVYMWRRRTSRRRAQRGARGQARRADASDRRDEARERVPGLNTEGAVAFAFEENAGYGDGYGSTIAFAHRARGDGGDPSRTRRARASRWTTPASRACDAPGNRRDAHGGQRRRPWADRIGRWSAWISLSKLELIEEAVIRVRRRTRYPIHTPASTTSSTDSPSGPRDRAPRRRGRQHVLQGSARRRRLPDAAVRVAI